MLCKARDYDSQPFWENFNAVRSSGTIFAIECPRQGSLLTE